MFTSCLMAKQLPVSHASLEKEWRGLLVRENSVPWRLARCRGGREPCWSEAPGFAYTDARAALWTGPGAAWCYNDSVYCPLLPCMCCPVCKRAFVFVFPRSSPLRIGTERWLRSCSEPCCVGKQTLRPSLF